MTTNLIYFGSPEFSATILESILESQTNLGIKVIGVVTKPDSPIGRKQIMTPSPVATLAEKYHLPTFKPEKLDEANLSHLKLLKPNLFLVASYGKIIPQSWLDAPTKATLNLHFSLLPKYRGALCISEAIKNQDTETGITLMEMDADLDHGPIISQAKQSIDIDDNVATLTNKLTQTAIDFIHSALPQYLSGKLSPIPQNHNQALLTPGTKSRNRETALIPWENIALALKGENATAIHALIRSLNPDPGAHTIINTIDLKIIKTKLEGGHLKIETVQMPGKSEISWNQFTSGHSLP